MDVRSLLREAKGFLSYEHYKKYCIRNINLLQVLIKFRLIDNQRIAMKFPNEVPWCGIQVGIYVLKRNFSEELHCNGLIFKESEANEDMKVLLCFSIYIVDFGSKRLGV